MKNLNLQFNYTPKTHWTANFVYQFCFFVYLKIAGFGGGGGGKLSWLPLMAPPSPVTSSGMVRVDSGGLKV